LGTGLPSFSFDPQPVAETPPSGRKIGGLWRRFRALVVDWLILLVFGIGLGAALFDEFCRIGPWGRLVGFFIALVYFAAYDSRTGEGQTFGKQWLKLRVVDAQGNTISFGKSLARYAIFAVPFFLYGLPLPSTSMTEAIAILLFTSVFGVGGSTLYLLIFNRATGQGLHDLAVGSFVVRAKDSGPVRARPIWKMHWAVVGLIFVLAIAMGALTVALNDQQTDSMPFASYPELMQDSRLAQQVVGAQAVNSSDSISHDLIGGGTKKILILTVFWRGKGGDMEASADQVAKLILMNDKKIQGFDSLRIVFRRDFDLGFAYGALNWSYERTLSEWRQRVLPAAPAQSPAPAKK
jgi:uncharacterized RDD family membrane protein YckC